MLNAMDADKSFRHWVAWLLDGEFRADLSVMRKLVTNPKTDLHSSIPWGDGQTILREALLVADHNSYHLGQLVLVRKALGTWKG
jgi:hypothetical protein